MKTKKSLSIGNFILILTFFTILVTACSSTENKSDNGAAAIKDSSSSANADEKIKISFYSYNLATPNQKEGTEQLIQEFEEANPNIEIEPVPVPAHEIATKIQADIVAGSRPDVAQIVFDSLDFAVQNYGAKALEDFVPAEELATNFEGFAANGLQLGQISGKTYGLAFTFSTPILFYNADLFEQAGLDPDVPPRTWEEVKEYALKITENTEADGIHITGATNFDWVVQGLIGSNGGKVLSDDRKTLMFGEPEAVGAIEMWQDLMQSGAHDKLNDSEVTQSFSEGNLGMQLTSSAIQSAYVAASEAGGWELKAASMPSFGDKPSAPVNSGSALVILSEDEKKQEAAWKFLKFVTSERGYTIITSQMGYLPLRPDIVDDPNYLKDYVEENPLVQPNLEQLDRLQQWVPYPGPNWYQIETTLLEGVQKSIQTTDNVATIMQEAQQRAQSMMP